MCRSYREITGKRGPKKANAKILSTQIVHASLQSFALIKVRKFEKHNVFLFLEFNCIIMEV